MRILVIGSGVVGVTTAWYLARGGHAVTVVDRQPEVALETSYGNAGQVSWSYATPWVSPDVPVYVMRWLLGAGSPLVLRPRLDPHMLRWMAMAARNCTPARFRRNRERMIRLARYSHACLQTLRGSTGISYDEGMGGTLQLFRDARALDDAARDAELLKRWDIDCEVLDRPGCIAVEPGLARARVPVAGGVRYPGDETGDCRKFTQALSARAGGDGVEFRQSVVVRALIADGTRIAGVDSDAGRLGADAFVVAAGSYSPALLRPLGIRLPVYPVKGYSATVPVVDPAGAPVSTLTDETRKVAVTRLGERIRVAGTAEIGGFDLTLPRSRTRMLDEVLEALFPGAGGLAEAEYWAGLRPMTPDNVAVLGETPYRNLYLNTGHGTLGWTMSCGSGRIVADLISGRAADVDLDGLTLRRFVRW
jgi:D-amino-acid dehydrogenase